MILSCMANLLVDIQQKQREIELHLNDLETLYQELGRSVSIVAQTAEIEYALDEFTLYSKELEKLEKAQKEYEQLATFIQQMDDRSRKIKQIEQDKRALEKPKQQAFSELGAIAYEAYGSDSLAIHIQEVCRPYFAEHQQKTQRVEARLSQAKGSLRQKMLRLSKASLRRQLLPLLIQAGSALMSIGCEHDLELEKKPALQGQLLHLKEREAELSKELELHKSAIAKLQSQEVQSPKARLEQCNIQVKQVKRTYERAASAYGQALYESLPDDVNANLIGQKALMLIDQITLHKKRMLAIEAEIQTLQNYIKAQELEAQVDLERQKIDHLKQQIDSYNRQIAHVSASIQNKQKQIEELRANRGVNING